MGWGGGRALICSVCQFLWCKYSHPGQFQAANVVSLNAGLERDKQKHTSMQPSHYTDKVEITSKAKMIVKCNQRIRNDKFSVLLYFKLYIAVSLCHLNFNNSSVYPLAVKFLEIKNLFSHSSTEIPFLLLSSFV